MASMTIAMARSIGQPFAHPDAAILGIHAIQLRNAQRAKHAKPQTKKA